MLATLRIIGAARAMQIEQTTGDVREIDPPGVLILHFMQAAFPASVAQCLPFVGRQCIERLFPELGKQIGQVYFTRLSSKAATSCGVPS